MAIQVKKSKKAITKLLTPKTTDFRTKIEFLHQRILKHKKSSGLFLTSI